MTLTASACRAALLLHLAGIHNAWNIIRHHIFIKNHSSHDKEDDREDDTERSGRSEARDAMKGLEVSRLFFSEWLLPFIDREFPGLRSRMAAGRFLGSDAIGADDVLSKDHNWGPTVEIYVDDEHPIGDEELAARINRAAPSEFLGTTRRGGRDSAVTLKRTHALIQSIFGCVPAKPREWLCCTARFEEIESALYFLRHGALFHDGSGQLTALRNRFHSYPDDIQRLRLASCFYHIAHYGEYNFVWRLVERNDVIAMQMALGEFSKAVMRLHFYLDRDFAPYWKWLPHEFKRRGYAPQIHDRLLALPGLAPREQSAAIQSICAELRARLLSDGVVPDNLANPDKVPWFFRFREEVLRTIADREIRKLTW